MQHRLRPYISIIICIYNGEKTLGSTIDSVLNQNYPKDKYEIIFVDDGSKDNSASLCYKALENNENGYPLITYVLQENGGLSTARNTGIRLATGQVIAFIDQDAVATKNWVLNIAKNFMSKSVPQILGGPVLLLNKDSKFASLLYDSIFTHYMKNKHTVIGTNMAFSKELLDGEAPFHPYLACRGDETYIFSKLRHQVIPEQDPSVEVYHETPETLKSWLKTRYDNGYYSALLAFINEKHVNEKKKLITLVANKLLFFIAPIIIVLSLIIRSAILLWFGLFLCFLISFRRYFMTGYLKDLIKNFWVTRKGNPIKKVCLVPVIICLVLVGYYYEDGGYIYNILSSMLLPKEYDKPEIFKNPVIIEKKSNIIS